MAIKARNFLPNPVMRFCTGELKVKTCSRYVRQVLGWDKYHNAIGYRSDEPKRVHRLKRRAETVKTPTLWDDWVITDRVRGGDVPPGETPAFPLFDAGIDLAGVRAFWAAAPFDLGLEQDEGNCDLCFLKGGKKIVAILQDRPDLANWWIAAEEMGIGDTERSGLFRKDRPSYRELVTIASGSPDAERWGWMEDGTSCGDTDCRCTD